MGVEERDGYDEYSLQKCQCHKRQRKTLEMFQMKGN